MMKWIFYVIATLCVLWSIFEPDDDSYLLTAIVCLLFARFYQEESK